MEGSPEQTDKLLLVCLDCLYLGSGGHLSLSTEGVSKSLEASLLLLASTTAGQITSGHGKAHGQSPPMYTQLSLCTCWDKSINLSCVCQRKANDLKMSMISIYAYTETNWLLFIKRPKPEFLAMYCKDPLFSYCTLCLKFVQHGGAWKRNFHCVKTLFTNPGNGLEWHHRHVLPSVVFILNVLHGSCINGSLSLHWECQLGPGQNLKAIHYFCFQ